MKKYILLVLTSIFSIIIGIGFFNIIAVAIEKINRNGRTPVAENIPQPFREDGESSRVFVIKNSKNVQTKETSRADAIVGIKHIASISTSPLNDIDGSNNIINPDLISPKSVIFSDDGTKVYINALESYKTLICDAKTFKPLKTIRHTFNEQQQNLFTGTIGSTPYEQSPYFFSGKPVESTLSHNGAYLWVPYYRKSTDEYGLDASAVAVINTKTDKIIRLLPSGPISKVVAISPNNTRAAVIHWGNNTLGILDISSNNPFDFYYTKHIVVDSIYEPLTTPTSRDSDCGLCLRGAIFLPDNTTLLVARMSGGGIAFIDTTSGTYLGSSLEDIQNPRDIKLSPDGNFVFITDNNDGFVTKIPIEKLESSIQNKTIKNLHREDFESVFVGFGARTISLSKDGSLFAIALNNDMEIALFKSNTLAEITRVKMGRYPVGIDISPDNHYIWVTYQTKNMLGADAVDIFKIEYQDEISS